MVEKALKGFLDENNVRYVTIKHSPAFTAQEIAASAHIPGREMAKSVVVKLGRKMAIVVLPASARVDFDLLREAVAESDVRLATEAEFRAAFPGCELGAMPPFGHLYGMDTFVSPKLTEDEEIAFNAGTHTELIRMRWTDFERLAQPRIVALSWPR
jgi:Ala-tRNA(Pro) deacylase